MAIPWTLLHGDALDVLAGLPAASVQCVITSPPYYSLRDYGEAGQIGLEASPAAYVARLVAVFREVRRILRDDGTLWINCGDSFGDKQLLGIPWRLAFALQADGWTLRSDGIWAKPNPMPESVQDRPTRSHEYLFMFSKRATYFYDAAAIAEPCVDGDPRPPNGSPGLDRPAMARRDKQGEARWALNPVTSRNKRSVWTIPTQPTPLFHFATMPEKLVEPCILAGSRPGDTVLDPFVGSGTTCLVAARFNRRSIGIDISAPYLAMAERRLMGQPMALPLWEAAT